MASPEFVSADAAAAASASASCGVNSAAAAAAGDPAAAAAGDPLSLNIVATAHALGEQNGLRHRDYHRYRLYLSRRLRRLREQVDLKQGRHRYACKPIPESTRDPRHLLVLLLQAERAWSYGMQLKNDNANSPTPSAKLRAHSIRRFSKALRHARQLEAMCKGLEPPPAATAADAAAATAAAAAPAAYNTETALCDGKTCLDAAAYRCFMESLLQQEKGQWSAAAATLQQLQQLYVQLKRLSSTQPELEALYRSKQEGIDPVLRLCIFHSGDIRAAAAAAQREETARSSRAQATAAAEAAAAASKGGCSSSKSALATWRGAPVDPSKEKPRAAVAAALEVWLERQLLPVETLRALAAAAAVADIQAAAPKLAGSDAQGWAEQYGDAAARFRGCVELIHKEMLSNPEDASWLQAEGFCMDMSRCLEVERDALMLLRCLLSLGSTDAKMRGSRELSAAHEGFRFASLLLQGLERMQGEETLPESRRPLLQRWIQAAKDGKAACLATAIACDGDLAEAFVLARAVSTRQVLRAPQAELRDDPHERIDLLSAAIQKATAVVVGQRECRYLCALLRQTRDLQGPLSFGGASSGPAEDSHATPVQKKLNSTVARLLLPPPEPIACKPHLFDLVLGSLNPPDLSAKVAGSSRSGLKGLLKSFWRR